ncbi:MAG: GNAT family N-acetyltransferase [Bacteroidales bacterium]|nr:GNAT family N-acetyltransferase [Bacteroidales bacterium]
MRILETERLILKPVEVEDLKYLLNLRWDKEVMEYLIHDPISFKDQTDWYNSIKKTDVALSIFLKENNELKIIGTIGLYDIKIRHQRAILRVRLDPTQQGKGYAKEAMNLILDYGFNTLNLNKIISDSFVDNTAIINLTLKLGFKQEGLLVGHYFHKGEFRDAYQFGLLRKDFNNRKTSTI